MTKPVGLIALLSTVLLGIAPVSAADIQVHLHRLGQSGGELVFEPAMAKLEVGDRVTFIPSDKSLSVQSIAGMLPRGASEFHSQPGKTMTVTFIVEGAYGVKNPQHYGQGMVGLIIVGDAAYLDATNAINPKPAQDKFDAMFASLL